MRHFATLFALSLALLPAAHALPEASPPLPETTGRKPVSPCIKSVCFPVEWVRNDAPAIPLRGVALMRYWGFRVYAAALYAGEQPKHDPASVLEDIPKQLTIHYLREISAADLRKSTEEIIKQQPWTDMAKLRERLDKVYSIYETVKEGDRYTITYEPGNGTTIALNGVAKGTIEGADFAKSFFGIWLAEECVGEGFRKKIIGIEE